LLQKTLSGRWPQGNSTRSPMQSAKQFEAAYQSFTDTIVLADFSV
jgi:hypothetical protein